MAVTFIKRSSLPETVKGKVGTLAVTITSNGQLQLSSIATKFMDNSQKIGIAYDSGKVMLFKETAKAIVKASKEDLFTLKHSKKGGTSNVPGSSVLLRDAATFTNGVYDYKASGNQSFPVEENVKSECLTFVLPVGALTPKPKQVRTKKVKPAAVAAVASSPNTVAVDEALELE